MYVPSADHHYLSSASTSSMDDDFVAAGRAVGKQMEEAERLPQLGLNPSDFPPITKTVIKKRPPTLREDKTVVLMRLLTVGLPVLFVLDRVLSAIGYHRLRLTLDVLFGILVAVTMDSKSTPSSEARTMSNATVIPQPNELQYQPPSGLRPANTHIPKNEDGVTSGGALAGEEEEDEDEDEDASQDDYNATGLKVKTNLNHSPKTPPKSFSPISPTSSPSRDSQNSFMRDFERFDKLVKHKKLANATSATASEAAEHRKFLTRNKKFSLRTRYKNLNPDRPGSPLRAASPSVSPKTQQQHLQRSSMDPPSPITPTSPSILVTPYETSVESEAIPDLDRICRKLKRLVDGECWVNVKSAKPIPVEGEPPVPFKVYQHRDAHHCLLVVTEIDASVEQTFEFVSSVHLQPQYESICLSAETLETVDAHTRIQRAVYETLLPSPTQHSVLAPRKCDLVTLVHTRTLPDGRLMNIATSIPHPLAPVVDGIERIHVNLIGLVVGPGKKPGKTRLAHLTSFSIGSGYVSKESLKRYARVILPKSVAMLHGALRRRQNVEQNLGDSSLQIGRDRSVSEAVSEWTFISDVNSTNSNLGGAGSIAGRTGSASSGSKPTVNKI